MRELAAAVGQADGGLLSSGTVGLEVDIARLLLATAVPDSLITEVPSVYVPEVAGAVIETRHARDTLQSLQLPQLLAPLSRP